MNFLIRLRMKSNSIPIIFLLFLTATETTTTATETTLMSTFTTPCDLIDGMDSSMFIQEKQINIVPEDMTVGSIRLVRLYFLLTLDSLFMLCSLYRRNLYHRKTS